MQLILIFHAFVLFYDHFVDRKSISVWIPLKDTQSLSFLFLTFVLVILTLIFVSQLLQISIGDRHRFSPLDEENFPSPPDALLGNTTLSQSSGSPSLSMVSSGKTLTSSTIF